MNNLFGKFISRLFIYSLDPTNQNVSQMYRIMQILYRYFEANLQFQWRLFGGGGLNILPTIYILKHKKVWFDLPADFVTVMDASRSEFQFSGKKKPNKRRWFWEVERAVRWVGRERKKNKTKMQWKKRWKEKKILVFNFTKWFVKNAIKEEKKTKQNTKTKLYNTVKMRKWSGE